MLLTGNAFAQSISGSVTDKKTGEALIGATVVIEGKNTGTTAPDHYQNINGTTNIEDSNWHFVVGTWREKIN
jgi:hypothetical protein